MKIGDDLANSHADGVIRVRWWVVGLSGFVAGIGGLGALAIVATVKNLDTLSTVALALAVLAFVIQIIVFIAEAANSRQQSKSMYEINAETKMLLEELRTRSLVTNEILNHQYNRLLDSLLQRTQETVTEVSSSETLSAEDVARLVSADVRAVVDAARTGINNMSSPVDLGQFQQINLSRSVNYHWPREHVQEILVRSGV